MNYPSIDSVIVELGPLALRWYGLMYVLGFAAFYLLAKWRIRRRLGDWTAPQVADLIFYGVVGVVAGGRLGYALFYGIEKLLSDPLWALRIWEGGMSFHGGLVGVLVAVWLYARNAGRQFLDVADFVAPLVPIGLGLGRVGNFINAELPGRVTELPFGVHFPCAAVRGLNYTCFGEFEPVLRHVSSLYQAATEGLLLFLLVWFFAAKPRLRGRLSGLFLLGYGSFRFCTEFVRQPDAELGFVALDWLTMGQLLSLPMVAFGLFLLFRNAARASP